MNAYQDKMRRKRIEALLAPKQQELKEIKFAIFFRRVRAMLKKERVKALKEAIADLDECANESNA